MSSERVRKLREAAEDSSAEVARRVQETGELKHLYGKPLQLDDDVEWLGVRVIRDAGFTHPALERARDLDEPQEQADRVLHRLQRRYAWMSRPEARATRDDIDAFNQQRDRLLAEYEAKLSALNRAILSYNLGVPTALHRLPVPVARTLERVREEIPALVWREPQRLSFRARLGLLLRGSTARHEAAGELQSPGVEPDSQNPSASAQQAREQ